MSVLQLEHVHVEADGAEIVTDVSLSFEQATVSVLMGPNGSGKSTLVNALFSHPHYAVSKGKVLFDGEDVTSYPPDEKAKKGLFLSLQHTPKVGGVTLAAFLHKAHQARTGDEIDLLEYYLELRELAQALSIDDGLLDRPLTAGLSGGQKKLSEVLQLAALRPRFAFLDEVDSGVDVDALKKVFYAIEQLRQEGTGFCIISHHPALLDHLVPDSVHVMGAGRLVRSGGEELAKEILRDGFCAVAHCAHAKSCSGRCLTKGT